MDSPSSSDAKLAWGILGAGNIARTFARGVARSATGRVLAVGSRSQAKADKFAEDLKGEFDIPRRYSSYEALLADREVRAVYIATPHPMHARWAIAAAEAGKHLLVEKPIGVNLAEAMTIIEAARANDVFLMEAYMYRCHPQTQKLVELIRQRVIGDVRVIHATFSFHWPNPFNPDSRLTANALAGGGILDVGGYCTSMARLIAGAAMGKDFAEPTEVKAVGHLESTGVDGYALALLRFPGDILAELATGVQLRQQGGVSVYGSEGHIIVPDPWIPLRDGGVGKIIIHRNSEPAPQEIAIEVSQPLYGIEADTVAQNLAARQAPAPAMTWDDTLGNMRTLDQWRQQIGLTYEFEQLENLTQPYSGRKLAHRPDAPGICDVKMKYGQIPGVAIPVSRLAQGADFSGHAPREALAVFDDAFERGINMFDTAYIYGASDKSLGHWVRSRGVRQQVVVLGKGAHPPHTTPEGILWQLKESLENLGLERIDLYMMHRDNPEIPVGEFVDVLDDLKQQGHIGAFGGSNWTIARVEEFNQYARSKGKTPLAAVSNNFSLARMVTPVWKGCMSASDQTWRDFLTRTQLTLVPWSSQARGFFTDRAATDKLDDQELATCWYSDDNFQRKARVNELAAKKGVEPINIALAYVLQQPFPTFPLIGPRRIGETVSSLRALNVQLSDHERKWLNLEV